MVTVRYLENRAVSALILLLALAVLSILGCSKPESPQFSGEAQWCGIEECYSFADRYWSAEKYRGWLKDTLGIEQDRQLYWNGRDSVTLPYHLPLTKNAEYYDLIGKCNQFRWGWVDYERQTEYSAHRDVYLDCLRGIGYPAEHAPTRP
jgi:hypothetical protein